MISVVADSAVLSKTLTIQDIEKSDTLVEMQQMACKVYKDRDVFGSLVVQVLLIHTFSLI